MPVSHSAKPLLARQPEITRPTGPIPAAAANRPIINPAPESSAPTRRTFERSSFRAPSTRPVDAAVVSRLKGDGVGPSLVDLLDEIQRAVFDRMPADRRVFQFAEELERVAVEARDPVMGAGRGRADDRHIAIHVFGGADFEKHPAAQAWP